MKSLALTTNWNWKKRSSGEFILKQIMSCKRFITDHKIVEISMGIGIAFAVFFIPALVEAAIGIEAGGKRIHGTLVGVGKWVIIVKGSIDCIQSVLNGDVSKAKQQFFGYLLCFGIMLALPWALDEVEGIFQ